MLVGCQEEDKPKRKFPAVDNEISAEQNNSNNSKPNNSKPNNSGNSSTIKPNSQANSNNSSTSNNSSSSGKKRVAITYDDGPHNVRTKAIVDELSSHREFCQIK